MFSFLKRDNSLSNVDKVYGIVVDQSRNLFLYRIINSDNIDGRFDVLGLHMFSFFLV